MIGYKYENHECKRGILMSRKTHHKIVLDVVCESDYDFDITERLRECEFEIMEPTALDEGADVLDITVESVECTDSR